MPGAKLFFLMYSGSSVQGFFFILTLSTDHMYKISFFEIEIELSLNNFARLHVSFLFISSIDLVSA